MKIRYALGAAVAAAMLTAGTAAAEPPTHSDPAGPYTVHIPAELTPCGAFVMDAVDNQRLTLYSTDHGALVATLTGSLKATVTSVVSRRSMDVNISGPLRVTSNGD